MHAYSLTQMYSAVERDRNRVRNREKTPEKTSRKYHFYLISERLRNSAEYKTRTAP